MKLIVLFLSGILTALPLVIPQLHFIAWISVTPLIYLVLNFNNKKAYRYGLVWSIGYYGVLYYWFICLYPMDFAGLDNVQSIAAVATAWIGMSLMQGLELALVPFLFRKINKSRCNIMSALLFAALWVILEWFQTLTWTGVPWGRLAVSQYKMTAVIQSASVFGSLFISFLIIFVNALLAIGFHKMKNAEKHKKYSLIAVGIYCVNLIFGCVSLIAYNDSGEPVKAALIQGNIASGQKWADDSVSYSFNKYIELSQEAVDTYSPDIILWPETVITTSILYSSYYDDLSEFAKSNNVVLAFGTYDIGFDKAGEVTDTYNAIVTFDSDGNHIKQPYYKRHLVPFGEYLPMPEVIRFFLPVLAELNVFKDDLTQGTESAIAETSIGKIGYLICFDSIYETLSTDTTRNGAEIIALSTNDSWYKDSAAVYQHNGHAVLRAVENGRYIMRAANTGVSSIIRADGKISNYLEPLVEGIVYGEVHMRTNRTIYTYIGNLIVWLSIAYTVSTAIYTTVNYHHMKQNIRKNH